MIIKFCNFADNKMIREVGFLLSIQYDVELPFSTATTFVAALYTSWHADVSHVLSLLPASALSLSLFCSVSIPSSTILFSSSSQPLLSIHHCPRPK